MNEPPYTAEFIMGAWILDTTKNSNTELDLDALKDTPFYEGLVTMAEFIEPVMLDRELRHEFTQARSDLMATTLKNIVEEFKHDDTASAIINGRLKDLADAIENLKHMMP